MNKVSENPDLNPANALTFLDEVYCGLSPTTLPEVSVGTNNGTIESPVKIPAGHASVTATLTSSTVKGTATVKAKAEFLRAAQPLNFCTLHKFY